MAEHVDLVREAARLMRLGHVPTLPSRRRIAELLDGAAAREESHLALQPRHPGHVTATPGPGDEAWLAVEISRAYLGREVSGG